ncbi:hypothetical protein TNCT_249321 [Trichonephila clavata]|uniref:Uncharacterized protein n=1 Tax=Trichonephila clavata TaxID=2740835 RepID=A0A8X6HP43_TRICU|nr:hypothetical protein TNCT_249321 [Trichonephila clavata]
MQPVEGSRKKRKKWNRKNKERKKLPMELIDHWVVLGPSARSLQRAEGFPDDFSLPWLKLTNGSVSAPPPHGPVLVYWYCITETRTEALTLLCKPTTSTMFCYKSREKCSGNSS